MQKTTNLNRRYRVGAWFITGAFLSVTISSHVFSRTEPPVPRGGKTKEAAMSRRATGQFEVKLATLALDDNTADALLGRRSIDKTFVGELEATSKGEMLSAGTAVKGSAGYVAIEMVTGKLNDCTGTFVLQHSGTIKRGDAQLTVTVVPDSGTGQLVGLAGKMSIKIVDKKHLYEFEYSLPEQP